MATPVFNNGIFHNETRIQATSGNIDSYHLLNMLSDTKPDDIGVIDLWIYSQKVESPLYQLADFNGKNTIMVNNPKGEFKWTLPTTDDLPSIVEDIEPENTRKGEDGTTFRIKLNKQRWSHSAIITYDKMNGAELIVTDDDIIHGIDFVIYTVKIRNTGTHTYLDNKFLAPGTKWFRTSSSIGQYSQRYDEVFTEVGGKEMYNFVGNDKASFTYQVDWTSEQMMRAGLYAGNAALVNQIWQIDKSVYQEDPSLRDINSFNELISKRGTQYLKDLNKEGKLTRSFVTGIESAGISKMVRDNENDLMWGKGGINQTGMETLRSSVGLWKQLDNAYKYIFNIDTFSLDMFESEIFNFYNGRVNLDQFNPNRTIVVQTGLGGHKLVQKAIQDLAFAQNLTTQSTEIGAITQKQKGNPFSLHFGFGFSSYTIPYLANIQFVINPALDNQVAINNIENPIIQGHPLSSYSFIVFDITDGAQDNIILLKKAWDHDITWRYINGKCDYLGRKSNFQSSGGNFGYRVDMELPKSAIFVKDPTKVLKFVARNPITGGSI